MLVLDGELSLVTSLDGDMTLNLSADGEYGTYIPVSYQDIYTGATEVTPSQETQVLPTADKVVVENIVINPIPNNYGLITWNGAVLTVS